MPPWPMDQQRAQVGVAALGYTEQSSACRRSCVDGARDPAKHPGLVLWRRFFHLPTAATSAVAFSTPIPGLDTNRRAASLSRASSMNSRSNASIAVSSSLHSSRISATSCRIRLFDHELRIDEHACRRHARVCGAPGLWSMPRSNSIARSWLIRFVRSATRRERTRCRVWTSSCCWVFISTKRIVGREAASAIPSASRSSFLCAFT